jgi:hypothetical protein
MQVPEVDVIDTQTAKRRVDRFADMLWCAIDTARRSVPATCRQQPELCGQDGLLPAVRQSPSHKLLISPYSVCIRRVNERTAQLEGTMDGRDRFPFVTLLG